MFEELDTIELTHDIKEHSLKEGDMGAVVLVYKNSKAYEVEFVTPGGRTKALLTLMPDDIRPYIKKDEYMPYRFNAPISLGTVSGITNTATVISKNYLINNLMIRTRITKSKINTEEFYPFATL